MMPSNLLKQLKEEDFWNKSVCIHSGEKGCQAEHSLFYGKKAIQERFAIVPVLPEYNYNPSARIKEKGQYIALLQCKEMGEWENAKAKYPKKDWDKEFELLQEKYKKWDYFKTDKC